MHARDPGSSQPQLVRKGIVAQSTVRLAAGAGVVAASLLILGPFPAEAVADKHGSGSHTGNDDWLNRSDKPGSGSQGPGRNLTNSIRDGLNAVGAPRPSIEPPPMNLGTSSSDLGAPMTVESFAVSDAPVAMRSAAVDDLPTINAAGAVPRSGSDYAGPPAASFRSPRVVIGNGRTPGRETSRRSSRETPEAVPAVPAAIEINIPPPPPPLPPVERMRPTRLAVGELGTATVGTVADPLAGLVGLILIPAVGAVLGVRQARAAQALRESTRT